MAEVKKADVRSLADALKELAAQKGGRKFLQSIDLSIGLKDLDTKRAENRFVEEVALPSGRAKPAVVGVIGSGLAARAKDKADVLIDEQKLSEMERDKKVMQNLIKKCDFFIAEAPLMLRIGKSLGKFLGPQGKMPKPFAPGADPSEIIKRLKNTVRIRVTESPAVHCNIGSEKMSAEDLERNFEAVMSAVEKKLPKGRANLRSVHIKPTMGRPIRVRW